MVQEVSLERCGGNGFAKRKEILRKIWERGAMSVKDLQHTSCMSGEELQAASECLQYECGFVET